MVSSQFSQNQVYFIFLDFFLMCFDLIETNNLSLKANDLPASKGHPPCFLLRMDCIVVFVSVRKRSTSAKPIHLSLGALLLPS